MHRTLRPTLWATLLCALTAIPLSAQVPITLVTNGYDGQPTNGNSYNPSVSRNGRFVAYQSLASNMVPGDANLRMDIFVTDRWTGKTVCASVPTESIAPIANDRSINPSISADGNLVTFASFASNLVPGDTNGAADIFVRNLSTRTTRRVSVSSNGTEAQLTIRSLLKSENPSISSDGRVVTFVSTATNLAPGRYTVGTSHVFSHNIETHQTINETGLGNKSSGMSGVGISSDGRYIAFHSEATNLIEGVTNGTRAVFVRDRQGGITELVSASSNGDTGNGLSGFLRCPKISEDGRFTLFDSLATDLAPGGLPDVCDLFLRDRETGTIECLTPTSFGNFDITSDYTMDATGSRVVYLAARSPGDSVQLVLWDRITKQTRVLVSPESQLAPPVLHEFSSAEFSSDGRYVAFEAAAPQNVPSGGRYFQDIYILGPLSIPSQFARTGEPCPGGPAAYSGITYTGSSQGQIHAHSLDKGLPWPGFPVNVSALVGTPVSLLGRPAVYGYDGPTGEPALYLTTDKGHVVKMGLDGKLHWKAQPDPTATRCSSTPAVTSNGQVFVGLNGALGPRVFRLDARTGSVVAASVWLGKGTGDITSLAVVGDRVYGGVTDGTYGSLVMLDATSLFPLARSIAPGEGVTAPPYVLGQWAWAGTLTGNLYKMSVNTFNPDPLFDKAGGSGKAELGVPIPGGIFPGTDKLYVGTSQGKVFAIDPITGAGKSQPFYDTGTTEPINGVLVDKATNTLHFGCGSRFYSVPLANPAGVKKEPVEGKLLSSPVLDPWTKMVIVATDTGNLYRFNP